MGEAKRRKLLDPSYGQPRILATRLYEIYNALPQLECKGLCQDSCGPIQMLPAEAQNITDTGLSYPSCDKSSLTCSALENGRCSIYQQRPLICRLWGIAEEMPCPFGCQPERRIGIWEAVRIFRQVEALKEGEPVLTLKL